MRPRCIERALILGVLGAFLAVPAAAQPSGKPAASQSSAPVAASSAGAPGAAKPGAPQVSKPAARTDAELDALYKEAVRAMKARKYDLAYKNFKMVWESDPTPTTAGNLGSVELKLKKYRDAAEHLEIFLREEKDLDPDERKDAEGELAQAKAQVITLRVEVSAPGAEIRIDDQPAGTSPIDHDLFLESGPHRILAQNGEAIDKAEINDGPGSVQKVRLEPKAPVKDQAPPPPPPHQEQAKPFPTRIVLLAAGGVVLVAGVAFMGAGAGQKGDALSMVPKDATGRPACALAGSGVQDNGSTQDCDKIRSLAGTADDLWRVGLGVLIAGGAVMASAALPVWSTSPTARDTVKSQLIPIVGPGSAGILWQGNF